MLRERSAGWRSGGVEDAARPTEPHRREARWHVGDRAARHPSPEQVQEGRSLAIPTGAAGVVERDSACEAGLVPTEAGAEKRRRPALTQPQRAPCPPPPGGARASAPPPAQERPLPLPTPNTEHSCQPHPTPPPSLTLSHSSSLSTSRVLSLPCTSLLEDSSCSSLLNPSSTRSSIQVRSPVPSPPSPPDAVDTPCSRQHHAFCFHHAILADRSTVCMLHARSWSPSSMLGDIWRVRTRSAHGARQCDMHVNPSGRVAATCIACLGNRLRSVSVRRGRPAWCALGGCSGPYSPDPDPSPPPGVDISASNTTPDRLSAIL